MRLRRFTYDEGMHALSIFREEFGVGDRRFGIHGQKPFAFRMPDARTVLIEYERTPLAQVSYNVSYEDDGRYVDLVMKTVHDFILPDQVSERLQRCAQAVSDKVKLGLDMRGSRKDALSAYIHEMTGPSEARKARVKITTPDAALKLRALRFPGIWERVLPERFYVKEITREARGLTIHVSARDADDLVSVPVMRLESGNEIHVLGPGNRKSAKDVFAEALMDDALHLTRRITSDEKFLRAATRVVDAQRTLCELVLPELNYAQSNQVSLQPHRGSYDGVVPTFERETELGDGFSVRFKPTKHPNANMYQLMHDGVVFYDTLAGMAPGGDERLFADLVPALALRAVSRDHEFLSRSELRTVMAEVAVRPDMDEAIKRLVDGEADEPNVDLYL